MKKITHYRCMGEVICGLYSQMVTTTKGSCKEKLGCMLYLFNMFSNKIKKQEWLKGNENTMSFLLRTTFVDDSWIENEQTHIEGTTVRLQNRMGI
jgi:hypothetical protein